MGRARSSMSHKELSAEITATLADLCLDTIKEVLVKETITDIRVRNVTAEIAALKKRARAWELLLLEYEKPCYVCDGHRDCCNHMTVVSDEEAVDIFVKLLEQGNVK